jgi:hypothetical protein
MQCWKASASIFTALSPHYNCALSNIHVLAAFSDRVCVKKQYITRILYSPMPDCFTFLRPFCELPSQVSICIRYEWGMKRKLWKKFPSSAPCMWATYNQTINQINGTGVKNEILNVMKWNLRTVGIRFLEFTFRKLSWRWSHDARMHM